MRKIIFCLLFLIVACSKNEQLTETFIKNAQNESIYIKLDGWQNLANHKLAFLQHGLASNMSHSVIQTTKKALLNNGYFVVTFDSRYSLGKSDGEVQYVNLSTFTQDLTDVINWAKSQPFYHEPFTIGGHSLGGASVILYAANHQQQIDKLIPITPVISGELWEASCMKNMPDFCKQWKKSGFYEYKTTDKTATIPYQLVEESKAYDAMKLVSDITAHTLLVSAKNDIVVDPHDVQNFAQKLQTHAQFTLIPQSDHNFESKQNQTDLYKVISDFTR